MKKLTLSFVCFVALALAACGGKSGGSASSSESSDNGSGLVDGKWPAAVYDKYGIPEIPTKGHIVCTDLSGEDGSYLYRVYYKGVTREEMQAWVKSLKEKGFRIADWQQEKVDKADWDYDIFLYQCRRETPQKNLQISTNKHATDRTNTEQPPHAVRHGKGAAQRLLGRSAA